MVDNLINFLHIMGTAVWVGGAIFIKIVLTPALSKIDSQQSGIALGIVAKRFSIAAWISIIVLVITGFLKTPTSMLLDVSSEIGVFLTVKHIFIIVVILLSLAIVLLVVPAMRKVMPKPGEKPTPDFIRYSGQLERLSLINTILGVLIVFCASFL